VTWKDDTAYGVVSQSNRPDGERLVHLVSSRDGLAYKHIHTFKLTGGPNETTLRFMPDDRLVALVRREAGDRSGYVGVSPPPYADWEWRPVGLRLGGPNFIRLPDGRLIAGSRHYEKTADGKPAYSTHLTLLTESGGFTPILRFESSGDTSYPGMLIHDGRLWISYYSSHQGKAAIYLAKIPLGEIPLTDAGKDRTP
jgi:hypothetical protein